MAFRSAACTSTDCGRDAVLLRWSNIKFPNTAGYYTFVDGTRIGSPSSSPYMFYGMHCGTTLTLGVQAHDASGKASKLYATSYTTAACAHAPASGVTLQAIDGGNNYFCSHNFTQACRAGWDAGPFCPIATFNEVLNGSGATQTIDAYKKVGINTFQAINYNGSPGLGNATLLEKLNEARMFVLGESVGSNRLYTSRIFGLRRSTVGMVIASRRGRSMSSSTRRSRRGVSVAGRSSMTGSSTSIRTSCPSRGGSVVGSLCMSASVGVVVAGIRAVTSSRPPTLWERPRACSARGRSRWRPS